MPTLEELQEDLNFLKQLKSALEQALLEGSTQLEISIAGRSVRYRSFDEMIRARQYVEREIERIETAIRIMNGEKVSRIVKTRFVG